MEMEIVATCKSTNIVENREDFPDKVIFTKEPLLCIQIIRRQNQYQTLLYFSDFFYVGWVSNLSRPNLKYTLCML